MGLKERILKSKAARENASNSHEVASQTPIDVLREVHTDLKKIEAKLEEIIKRSENHGN